MKYEIKLLPGCLNFIKNNKNKIAVVITSLSLVATLNGCATAPNNQKAEINNETQSEQIEKDALQELDEYLDSVEEKSDTKLEEGLNVLKDGASKLKDAAKDAWNSESTQNEKEKLYQEFDKLLGFLFNDEEMSGLKFNDLTESGKNTIKNTFNKLDDLLKEMIGDDYLERFRAWSVEKGASGLNALENCQKNFGDWRDDVIDKYNQSKTNQMTYKKSRR